jgi:hypothetical protein
MDAKLFSRKVYLKVEGVPRKAVHASTDPFLMVNVLDDLGNLTNYPADVNAADLGGGLCAAVTTLDYYLKCLMNRGITSKFHVTSFEMSDKLNMEAENIIRIMGMEEHISIIKRDFTELTKEHLKLFNLIYISWPFLEDFGPVMNKVFPRINSGTTLIARNCSEATILEDRSFFSPYYDPRLIKYGGHVRFYSRTDKEVPQESK